MEKYLQRLQELIAKPDLTPLEVKEGMLAIYVVISQLNQTQGEPSVGLKQEPAPMHDHINGFMGAIFWERGFNFENPTLEQIAEVKIMVDGMTQIYAMPERLQNALNDVYDVIVGRAKGLGGQVADDTGQLLGLSATLPDFESEPAAPKATPEEEAPAPSYGHDHEIASILSEIPSDSQASWEDQIPPDVPSYAPEMPDMPAAPDMEAAPEHITETPAAIDEFDPAKIFEEEEADEAPVPETTEPLSDAESVGEYSGVEAPYATDAFDPSKVFEEEAPVPEMTAEQDDAPSAVEMTADDEVGDDDDFDPAKVFGAEAPLPETSEPEVVETPAGSSAFDPANVFEEETSLPDMTETEPEAVATPVDETVETEASYTTDAFDPSRIFEEEPAEPVAAMPETGDAEPAVAGTDDGVGGFAPLGMDEEEMTPAADGESLGTEPVEPLDVEEAAVDASAGLRTDWEGAETDFDMAAPIQDDMPMPEMPADENVEELVQEIEAPAPPVAPLSAMAADEMPPMGLSDAPAAEEVVKPKTTKVRKTRKKADSAEPAEKKKRTRKKVDPDAPPKPRKKRTRRIDAKALKINLAAVQVPDDYMAENEAGDSEMTADQTMDVTMPPAFEAPVMEDDFASAPDVPEMPPMDMTEPDSESAFGAMPDISGIGRDDAPESPETPTDETTPDEFMTELSDEFAAEAQRSGTADAVLEQTTDTSADEMETGIPDFETTAAESEEDAFDEGEDIADPDESETVRADIDSGESILAGIPGFEDEEPVQPDVRQTEPEFEAADASESYAAQLAAEPEPESDPSSWTEMSPVVQAQEPIEENVIESDDGKEVNTMTTPETGYESMPDGTMPAEPPKKKGGFLAGFMMLLLGLVLGGGGAYYYFGVYQGKSITDMETKVSEAQKALEEAKDSLAKAQEQSKSISAVLNQQQEASKQPVPKPLYTKVGKGAIVYWEDTSPVNRTYHVYRAKGAKGDWKKITEEPLNKDFILFSNVSAGTWKYAVTAIDLEGNETEKSEELSLKFPLKK